MDRSDVAEVLETAADLYKAETIEWCQGYWVERSGPQERLPSGRFGTKHLSMCAEGALMTAAGFTLKEIDRIEGMRTYLELENDPILHDRWQLFMAARVNANVKMYGVIEYNDTPGRTKQEIIDAFEATAKDLRNGEGTLND